jgi:hypothetical protein
MAVRGFSLLIYTRLGVYFSESSESKTPAILAITYSIMNSVMPSIFSHGLSLRQDIYIGVAHLIPLLLCLC